MHLEKSGLQNILIVIAFQDQWLTFLDALFPILEYRSKGGMLDIPEHDAGIDIPGIAPIVFPDAMGGEQMRVGQ
jgi:hypothetical protein